MDEDELDSLIDDVREHIYSDEEAYNNLKKAVAEKNVSVIEQVFRNVLKALDYIVDIATTIRDLIQRFLS